MPVSLRTATSPRAAVTNGTVNNDGVLRATQASRTCSILDY